MFVSNGVSGEKVIKKSFTRVEDMTCDWLNRRLERVWVNFPPTWMLVLTKQGTRIDLSTGKI